MHNKQAYEIAFYNRQTQILETTKVRERGYKRELVPEKKINSNGTLRRRKESIAWSGRTIPYLADDGVIYFPG